MACKGWLTLLVVVLVAACASTKVQTWQSKGFEQVQGNWVFYTWGAPALTDEETYSEGIRVIDKATRRHVNAQLAALGYVEDFNRAQFEVDYRVGSESVVGGVGGPMSPRDVHERALAGPNAEYEVSSAFYTHRTLGYHEFSKLKITLYDRDSRLIVWEGLASKLVDNPQAGEEQVRAMVGRAVDKVLRQLPASQVSESSR